MIPVDKKLPTILIAVFIVVLLLTSGLLVYTGFSLKQEEESLKQEEESQGSQRREAQELIDDIATQKWDPISFPINAKILKVVDRKTRLVYLQMSWPPHVFGISQEVKLNCQDDDFSLTRSSLSPQRLKEDPLEEVSPDEFLNLAENNPLFIGFCSDDACNTIDKGCRLIIPGEQEQ